MTSLPSDAKAILADREGDLSLGPMLHRWTPHPVLFGGDSLIFLEGEDHVRERRRLGPPFHGSHMRSYEQTLADLASRRVETWPNGEPLEFRSLAQEFVLDVMRTLIFGVSEHGRMRRLDEAMVQYCRVVESDAFLGVGVLGVTITGRWRRYPPLDRAAAAVDEIVLEEFADRRSGVAAECDDFLSRLLAANDEAEDPKDDATLARDMRGLMLAGYETTAVTLASVAEQLVHHPRALERAHADVDADSHLYLDAVVSEAMRLRPAFPFTGRRALREFDLDGLRVPRGTMMVISVMALHERPELYEAPLEFKPERFLDVRPGTYTWLTFGGGPHRCLGASLALFESRILLRELLARRTLTAVGTRLRAPRQAHPMLVPAGNAPVILHAR